MYKEVCKGFNNVYTGQKSLRNTQAVYLLYSTNVAFTCSIGLMYRAMTMLVCIIPNLFTQIILRKCKTIVECHRNMYTNNASIYCHTK